MPEKAIRALGAGTSTAYGPPPGYRPEPTRLQVLRQLVSDARRAQLGNTRVPVFLACCPCGWHQEYVNPDSCRKAERKHRGSCSQAR